MEKIGEFVKDIYNKIKESPDNQPADNKGFE